MKGFSYCAVRVSGCAVVGVEGDGRHATATATPWVTLRNGANGTNVLRYLLTNLLTYGGALVASMYINAWVLLLG